MTAPAACAACNHHERWLSAALDARHSDTGVNRHLDTSDTSDTSVYRHQSDTFRHCSDTFRHSKLWRFRQVRCVGRVYRVSIVSNSDTLTLLTRPTRLATHVSPHKSPRMPTAKLGMQPMGLLGGSYPWPWPFGTTTPSTSAVGRHPDTSDTSDTQTLDT